MEKNDQNYLVQRIRSQYVEKGSTELDALRKLDQKVKKPATVVGWVLGIVGVLLLGSGMSLVMTDIGTIVGIAEPMVPGIVTGLAGMIPTWLAWPAYKAILRRRKKKYAARILELSDKLIEN